MNKKMMLVVGIALACVFAFASCGDLLGEQEEQFFTISNQSIYDVTVTVSGAKITLPEDKAGQSAALLLTGTTKAGPHSMTVAYKGKLTVSKIGLIPETSSGFTRADFDIEPALNGFIITYNPVDIEVNIKEFQDE